MIFILLTLAFQISAQTAVPGDPPTPPIRYILDVPAVVSDLQEVNKGCLARRNGAICECFMKNFKLKVNGRDVAEKDLKTAIDISWRRNEKQYRGSNDYHSLKYMMMEMESFCTDDPKWEMDIDAEEVVRKEPQAGKKPASLKPVPKGK